MNPSASFTHPLAKKPWHYLVLSADDEIPPCRWYQRRGWKSRGCVRYESPWAADWETFSEEEMVAGISERNRTMCFFLFSARPDFRIFLEPDPQHPRDDNAIKVMASATFKHLQADVRLGYLSPETARALKDVGEIDARPASVYLPQNGTALRVGIRILIRPLVQEKPVDRSLIHETAARQPANASNTRDSIFEEVYAQFDRERDSFHCQAVPKSLFRRAFDPYFDDALDERCLTEQDLASPTQVEDLDVNLSAVMISEMLPCIVETLLESHPELNSQQSPVRPSSHG